MLFPSVKSRVVSATAVSRPVQQEVNNSSPGISAHWPFESPYFFLSLMPLFGQRALFSQDRFPFLFFMFLSELLLPSIQTRNNRSFCFASAPRGSGMLLGVHITRDLYCGSGFQFPTLLATTTAATLNSRHETKIVSIKGGKGTKKLK